jgi:hypothetical protein
MVSVPLKGVLDAPHPAKDVDFNSIDVKVEPVEPGSLSKIGLHRTTPEQKALVRTWSLPLPEGDIG